MNLTWNQKDFRYQNKQSFHSLNKTHYGEGGGRGTTHCQHLRLLTSLKILRLPFEKLIALNTFISSSFFLNNEKINIYLATFKQRRIYEIKRKKTIMITLRLDNSWQTYWIYLLFELCAVCLFISKPLYHFFFHSSDI